MPSKTSDAPRPRIQSVARAASILLEVAGSTNGMKTKDISSRVGLSLQTTYHLLHTLTEMGLIGRNETNNFIVGLNVSILAAALKRQIAAPAVLAPAVREISIKTGETAYASGWWNGEIVNLGSSPGQHAVNVQEVPHGYSTDAHARASGKLLLAYASKSTRDDYLEKHPLRRITPKTVTSAKRMIVEIEKIRQQGYSIDREEMAKGLCCIAVPLANGEAPFCLSLTAPIDRFTLNFKQYLKAMQDVAGGVTTNYRTRAPSR